ncbi:LytTR family transcriptional regulator DNA-binding domain-containing protein [Paenibacillus allorhizosphaerae]|uniref:HTH LytTR-type domain-containing protein n=1 Tax=Paenibacillus allorhizosphaerae TaxID=2849866 RepID=A0ABN7TFA3_9BACL|nr:LytTR family transcriptional regulator DNA-binding domain-containing protein [Paenibacillus allorhizosphaerae]CAG7630885.1 hypothetical protein PAECIP111802_01686 [Paenibacillus allorhizosphaerae]
MGFWVYVKDMETGQKLNIHTDDCDFITVHKDRLAVFVIGNKKYLEQRGLESFAEDLESDLFRLTDRSHLVNFKKVSCFEENTLVLRFPDSDQTASVARIHRNSVEQYIRKSPGKKVISRQIENRFPLWNRARKFMR